MIAAVEIDGKEIGESATGRLPWQRGTDLFPEPRCRGTYQLPMRGDETTQGTNAMAGGQGFDCVKGGARQTFQNAEAMDGWARNAVFHCAAVCT